MNGVFSSELLPAISSIFWAPPQAAKLVACAAAASARALTRAASSATLVLRRMVTPFVRFVLNSTRGSVTVRRVTTRVTRKMA